MLSKIKQLLQAYNGLSNAFYLGMMGTALIILHPSGEIGRAGRLLCNGCFIEATVYDITCMHPFPWSLHPDNWMENRGLSDRIIARIERKLSNSPFVL
jgi:hypothetical protein